MAGKKHKYPLFVRRSTVAQVTEKGRTISSVAKEVGVTHKTLASWIKELGEGEAPKVQDELIAELEANLEPPPEEDTDDGEEVESDERTLPALKRLLAKTMGRIEKAEQSGRLDTAQKLGRDAGQLAAIVARLEKVESEDADVLSIRRSEIEEAQASVMAKISDLASKPIHCAECGRRLRVETAGGRIVSEGE